MLFGLVDPSIDPSLPGEYTVKSAERFISPEKYSRVIFTDDPTSQSVTTEIECDDVRPKYSVIFCIMTIREKRTLIVFESDNSKPIEIQVEATLKEAYTKYLQTRHSTAAVTISYKIEHLELIHTGLAGTSDGNLMFWKLHAKYGGWYDLAKRYFYVFGIKHSLSCIRSVLCCIIDLYLGYRELRSDQNQECYRDWLENRSGIGYYECRECGSKSLT